jgi:tRNA (mo5U34)-methyltransferase
MNSISWFHRIALPGLGATPGIDDSQGKWSALGLPERLDGYSVLDIGTWDGFFAFECEARGAAKVVAADSWVWENLPGRDRGFDFAHRVLRSQVEKRVVSVEQMAQSPLGEFDYVLFLGVLYHSRDPLGYLTVASQHTKGTLVIETHVDLQSLPYPAIRYYRDDELNDDSTNYWGPNSLAVSAMLADCGFSQVEVFPEWNVNRQVFHAKKQIGP